MKTLFEKCALCPRNCGVNRLIGNKGFCGESSILRIADIEAHFGEEPAISGKNGSGTVFFSGCSLKCNFCQNFQISSQGTGKPITVSQVTAQLSKLYFDSNIHNINFVTPDHFLPYTIEIAVELRRMNIEIPILYNLSGYQKVDSLKLIEPYTDIYLPDFKYADKSLAKRLSSAADYPGIALSAISEMIRQKGFLSLTNADRTGIELATGGVLVRHLILPGQTENSIDALTALFIEFGENLPLSLMSQFFPIPTCDHAGLDRRISKEEFDRVYAHALDLGFKTMYVQFPSNINSNEASNFLPDFTKTRPFRGNV